MMKMFEDMAFDMGTGTVEMYVRGKGLIQLKECLDPDAEPDEIFQERSIVSRRVANKALEATGDEAYRKIGRLPSELEIAWPVRRGRIFDESAFVSTMGAMIRRVYPSFGRFRHLGATLTKPMILVGVPCNSTLMENRAIRNLINDEVGGRAVIVSEPVEAAFGADLNFQDGKACTIVDIGGGTTDIAILAGGAELPYSKSFEYGGDLMDEAIVKHLKTEHKLGIGIRTAEWIKKKIGSACPFEDSRKLKATVRGRPLEEQREADLSSDEIRECLLENVLKHIASLLREHISKIEEGQVHTDLKDNGIWLTGGGSLIDGMDQYLTNELGLEVRRVEKPLMSVILGGAKILEDPDLIRQFSLNEAA
ncbi:MAG TPA: rod shape-determining protein [Patescibacteria group bacterium]|nr:rod shape-determining protein [Patescibacteria group bacterium]